MGEVVIEPATQDDVRAVHAIEEASFPVPWRLEFFVGELRAERRFNIVAKKDGEVVGYLFAMWIFEDLHVNKIAVVEPMRRQGIADLLMEHCIAFAKARSVETITLEVRQSNEGAQQFYRHLGFEPEYVRRSYYSDGESAVVMSREV